MFYGCRIILAMIEAKRQSVERAYFVSSCKKDIFLQVVVVVVSKFVRVRTSATIK